MVKILIIEDEKNIAEGIKRYLEKEKYEVLIAYDGITGTDMAFEHQPDLLILDLMLPGKSGFDVCKDIQREMNIPIIMLTARADEMDKVLGLEIGADDYMTKPFSPRELVARVRSTLRRMEKNNKTHNLASIKVEFGDFKYNSLNHSLIKNDTEEIPLTPIENDILGYMILNKNLVLSRVQILEGAGLGSYEGVQRTIDVHIYNLRQKIEKDPTNPDFVKTVYGVGYRFNL